MQSSTAAKEWQITSRYAVDGILGSGSYGMVYQAFDRDKERMVAIKRLQNLFGDRTICKRLLRELSILSRLDHRNVVRLWDIVQPADPNSFDEIYYAMEICDTDLKQLFELDCNLLPVQINSMFSHLLAGLRYIHSAQVYHRDLKPANCLVNKDCLVKICDFGLACTADIVTPRKADAEPQGEAPGQPLARRVMTKKVVTRWYRAPELILMQDNYTEAIDVWSAGCIYAEMLQMMEGTVRRCPLFPGKTCYPLSPHREHLGDHQYHSSGDFEQLNIIFNVLGTPAEEDIAQLADSGVKRYARSFKTREGTGLYQILPAASQESLELLGKMLMFNPEKRITVAEALSSGIFSTTPEDPSTEIAPTRITLDFEDDNNLDESRLRSHFLRMVEQYHPQSSPEPADLQPDDSDVQIADKWNHLVALLGQPSMLGSLRKTSESKSSMHRNCGHRVRSSRVKA